jgi:hypothetical protein
LPFNRQGADGHKPGLLARWTLIDDDTSDPKALLFFPYQTAIYLK